MSYFHYQDNVLFAEQLPVSKIAEEFGTPTYIYSKQAIEEAFLQFDGAFKNHPHRTCFSVKANSNLGVLSILNNLGAGFDIVSAGELERVRRIGADLSKVVFSGVGKQDWEIARALAAEIGCFNVESDSELKQIMRIATELDKVAPISIRVNPDVDAQTHPYISTGLKENKFGVNTDIAIAMYEEAAQHAHINIVGIDCHIGSQITTLAPFLEALTKILQIVDSLEKLDITLEHIDLGGGVGVKYKDETPVDMDTFAASILQVLGHRKQSLYFEPGRFIAANAGILLTQVIHLKENEGKHFAIVDGAMNDLIRPALYQSWQGVSPAILRDTTTENYDVVGPVCETGDFLAKDRDLALEPGDYLAINSAGAYGFVMSSNYNSRTRPAEVIVSEETVQCVRSRETFDDLMRLESTYDQA